MAGAGIPEEHHRTGEDLAVEDFRSLRRWLLVLGLVTIAALGVAVYAIVAASDASSEQQALEKRLSRLESKAEEEKDVERLEARLRRASEESDVVAIDRRLQRVENDVLDAVEASADAGKGNNRLQARIGRLQRRVERLAARGR